MILWSWGQLPSRRQHSNLKQLAKVTMGAARGCGNRRRLLSRRRVRNSVDGGRSSGCAQQSTCLLELFSTSGTPDAVIAYLGTTARQRVLQEATNELHTRDRLAAQLLAAVVAIAKGDHTVVNALQPAVADSHAKDVAGQIVEHLPARACSLAMGHPLFLPYLTRHWC